MAIVPWTSSRLALTEPNVLFDQPSIRQSHAFGELLFPPAIEPVARTRFRFHARSEFLRFATPQIAEQLATLRQALNVASSEASP